jgi:hypothetical protein
MAEIELSSEQQRQIGKLMAALAGDASLRERFEADSRGIFAEFGLAPPFDDAADLQVRVTQSEVEGFAGTEPHTDYVGPPTGPTNHIDWRFPGGPHHDMTHYDSSALAAGVTLQIVPRIGPAAP